LCARLEGRYVDDDEVIRVLGEAVREDGDDGVIRVLGELAREVDAEVIRVLGEAVREDDEGEEAMAVDAADAEVVVVGGRVGSSE
jgi:hypothetical protein